MIYVVAALKFFYGESARNVVRDTLKHNGRQTRRVFEMLSPRGNKSLLKSFMDQVDPHYPNWSGRLSQDMTFFLFKLE
jgi:hypothetical protein